MILILETWPLFKVMAPLVAKAMIMWNAFKIRMTRTWIFIMCPHCCDIADMTLVQSWHDLTWIWCIFKILASVELCPGHDFKRWTERAILSSWKQTISNSSSHWLNTGIHSIVSIFVFCDPWPLAYWFGLSSEGGICAKDDGDALHDVFIFTESVVWTKHMMVP